MNRVQYETDLLIIGGGPAGLAAAYQVQQSDARVTIVDENQGLGGQIWRGQHSKPTITEAAKWLAKIDTHKVNFIRGARVFDHPHDNLLIAESYDSIYELRYSKLILATGARERFLPFPGWTLPNVMGAGGLQALVKTGLPIAGRTVVIAGTGPLLLAVAAYLQAHDAQILMIAEQTRWSNLIKFGLNLTQQSDKLMQAVEIRKQLRGVPYKANCWPITARGNQKLWSVILQHGKRQREIVCDYLACGFHLLPNLELPILLGCKIENDAVSVNEYQETSIANVFCAGESTGIGGLELSLAEGQIAGLAAAGKGDTIRTLFDERAKGQEFANLLDRTFALREELKLLAESSTIVCRCEDVTYGQLQGYSGWRAAKLQTRCGMGPCQGRVCGGALEFLMEWKTESIRPPVYPAKLEGLIPGGARVSRAVLNEERRSIDK